MTDSRRRSCRCGGHMPDEYFWSLYRPHRVLVSGILRSNRTTSRTESQRWSRRVPKRRSTSRMPEADSGDGARRRALA
jgi:hypothetical protein